MTTTARATAGTAAALANWGKYNSYFRLFVLFFDFRFELVSYENGLITALRYRKLFFIKIGGGGGEFAQMVSHALAATTAARFDHSLLPNFVKKHQKEERGKYR